MFVMHSLNFWMQFERAVSDFTRVIELDSGNANAYFNRGSAYVFHFSIVFLFFCCSVHPSSISYDSLGEFDRAIADYTHALELDMAANAKTGGAPRQRGSGGLVE